VFTILGKIITIENKEIMNNPCKSTIKGACIRAFLIISAISCSTNVHAQQILKYPEFLRLRNQDKPYRMFDDGLPGILPSTFSNGKVVITGVGNYCSSYLIAKEKAGLRDLSLIRLKNYPTMDATGVYGSFYSSLANYAAFNGRPNPIYIRALPVELQKLSTQNSIIIVEGCGGRLDGPSMNQYVSQVNRPSLPDGRKAFLMYGRWCVFDNEEQRKRESIPQSGFQCVGMGTDRLTALEVLKSTIIANLGSQGHSFRNFLRPTPYPAKDMGSPAYYLFRANDYLARNPDKKVPDYYLGYGDKYIRRFTEKTYPTLSEQGKQFITRVARALQAEIESKLINDPQGFVALEDDSDAFTKFAYNTHPKAYCESGWAKLPKADRDKIIIDVDRADYLIPFYGMKVSLDYINKTGYDLAKMCGSYWDLPPTLQNLPSFR
jgi:hypothetical protein